MTLGEFLQEKRHNLGLSFEEIYKKTRLHPDVLKKLEEDRLRASSLHFKYLVQAYSHILNISDEELKDYLSPPPAEETKMFFSWSSFFKKFFLVFIPLFSAFLLNYFLNNQEEEVVESQVKDLIYLPHKEIFLHSIPKVRITSQQYPTYLTYQVDQGEVNSHFLLPYSFFELEGSLILLVIGDNREVELQYKNENYPLDERRTQSLVFPPERRKEFKLPLFFYTAEKEPENEKNNF